MTFLTQLLLSIDLEGAKAFFLWAVHDPTTSLCVLIVGLRLSRVVRKGFDQLHAQIADAMRAAVQRAVDELEERREAARRPWR